MILSVSFLFFFFVSLRNDSNVDFVADSNCSSNIDVGASNSFGPPLNLPLPILPASLQGLELTPGVTAALRRMLDEKNKKDALVTRMKTLMDWDAVGE